MSAALLARFTAWAFFLAAASDVDRRFSALAAVKGDPGCAEYLRRLREAATCVRMGRQP